MVRSQEERCAGGVTAEPLESRMQLDHLLERVQREAAAGRLPAPGSFLTISREVGSGGAEIATRLGAVLGWRVLDRELIEDMARRLELEPRLLSLIDETRVGWFSETLLNLFNSRLVLQGSFVSMLSHSIAAAACDGPVIVVGRAGHLVLPADLGLRVRCVAPWRFRLARVGDADDRDARQSRQRLDEMDAAREEFVRRHFHVDPKDPANYDLVIDTSRFGLDGSVQMIVKALEIRELVS
jgi:hypothetical protein